MHQSTRSAFATHERLGDCIKMIRFVGRACRLPGAASVEAFADLLYSGTCAVTSIPEDRWRPDRYFHPVPGTQGKTYSFAGGVIEDAAGFDPIVFGISPREAEYMDPQQRLFLQVVWEALEDAGLRADQLAGSNVGVFVGASMTDYGNSLANDPQIADGYIMSGNSLAVISNRVSHVFDWHGPSMTIDTACSSSLFALEAAAKALRSGQVEIAVVGATNMMLAPSQFVGFSAARMLSPTGLCQAFSENADGYVRGEGAVAFVLCRQDAEKMVCRPDYGRLLHVGLNTSGSTVNIALPSSEAQYQLLQAAYRDAGIDPEDLAFVEAHGTGTAAGDPVEADALGRALGQRRSRPLPIGSVKSNVGHLEPGAGCAGLLKALVALESGRLPPSLHAETLNPAIPFDDLNLQVVRKTFELPPTDGPCLAGISSFGFGGANAHAIIAGPESDTTAAPSEASGDDPDRQILFTSTFCAESLKASLEAYSGRLFDAEGNRNTRLLDELFHFRGVHPHRMAMIAQDAGSAARAVEAHLSAQSHPAIITAVSRVKDEPPVFVFSGNGAQYSGMSLAALAADDTYRAEYEKIDELWFRLYGWSLIEKLGSEELGEELSQAAISQPLLFAEQAAMSAAITARGFYPTAVIGHSAGEVAAALCAGALDLEQAVRLIHARSVAQEQLAGRGTMAALQVSEEDAREGLSEFGDPAIEIAAVNSPRSVSLVGPREALSKFSRFARRERRWACVPIKVNYAFHSTVQDEIEEELRDKLSFLSPQAGRIPFFSTVTGRCESCAELGTDYWWRNVRQPVRYQDAVAEAGRQGHRMFAEIGPDPVLTAYTRDSLGEWKDQVAVTFTAVRKDTAAVNPVLRGAARLLVNGARVDLEKLARPPEGAPEELFSYPWQNTSFRAGDSETLKRHTGRSEDFHSLLGFEADAGSHVWTNEIDVHMQPVFADHAVSGKPLLPGTALAELAAAAAQRSLGSHSVELLDFDMFAPVPMSARSISELRTDVALVERTVRIRTRPRFSTDAWREHAAGRIGRLPDSADWTEQGPAAAMLPQDGDGSHLYRQAEEIGLTYGPCFQRVSHYRMAGDNMIEVVLNASMAEGYDASRYAIDPVAADAVLHGLIGYFEKGRFADQALGFIPVRIGRMAIVRPGRAIRTGRISITRVGNRSILADITYFDDDGALVARFEQTRFRAVRLVQQIRFDTHAFALDLHPIDPLGLEDGHPAPLPTIDMLRETAVACAADAGDPDDAVLLLDAIAQRIAFDVASLFATNDVADGVRAVHLPKDLPSGTAAYLAVVLDLLEACGLARQNDDGRFLDTDCELPDADMLISGLLAERPGFVAECALLSQLRHALPALVSGARPWDMEAIFGRAPLENLAVGSPFAAERCAWLTRVIADTLDAGRNGRPLRIGELTAGVPRLLNDLAPVLAGTANEFWVIQTDPDAAPGVSAVSSGAVEPRRVALEDLEGKGPFDLIVGAGVSHTALSASPVFAKALDELRSQGVLAIVEQMPRAYLDLIMAARTAEILSGDSDAGGVFRLRSEEELADAASAAGATGIDIVAERQRFGGANLLLVQANAAQSKPETEPAPDTSTAMEHASQTIAASSSAALKQAPPLVAALHDAWREATGLALSVAFESDAALWYLAQRGSEPFAPLVLIAPDLSENDDADERMKSRLICLADAVKQAPAGAKPIWLICPNGAGHSGNSRQDPEQAALWTFLRTAKNEYPALELHAIDPDPTLPTEFVVAQITALLASDTPESEIVLTKDGFHALRVRKGAARPGRWREAKVSADDACARLFDDPAGGLDHLNWRRIDRPVPTGSEVLIEIEATGLNYRDVMWSMALLPEEALEDGFAGPTLGVECAGRVIQVGPDVTGLKVGDRVATFGPACFSTHMTIDEAWTGKLPDNVSADAAATVPVPFFTAFYGLHHLARLQEGETVLIHGGAGGVGLAAIQIAQWCGATIIATAGSETKRSLLHSLGVEHVFDSRSLEFVDAVREVTGGDGVDVVLNSLAGGPMERSIALLKPFGRFVELGKVDYYTNTTIGLRPLKENISYFAVDVDQLLEHNPSFARKLFAEMIELFHEHALAPLPLRVFQGNDVVDAFRTMQRSGHIGKIVVRPPAAKSVIQTEDMPLFKPHPESLTLIVGGGSGLGLILADRMVRGGATALALMGRSPEPSEEAREVIDRAAAAGTEIRYFSCDVADRGALDATLAELRAWRPITGVINSAMVLEDMRIAELDRGVLDRTLAAKVAGTRNLDRATRDDPVRDFVVFSSMSTLIGNHGQAAYVAANGYIEALIRRRRADGLPGLAVGWGAILDAGYLTRDKETAKLIRRFGGGVEFSARQAMRALEHLMAPGQQLIDDPVIWISPMAWAATVKGLRLLQGPTHRVLFDLGQISGDTPDTDDLREMLMALEPEQAVSRLVGFLTREIARILRVPENALSLTRPVAEYGVDSLMGVELGLAAQQALGDDIPLMTISDELSMSQIARKIIDHIQGGGSGHGILGDMVAQHMVADPVATVKQDASENVASEPGSDGKTEIPMEAAK